MESGSTFKLFRVNYNVFHYIQDTAAIRFHDTEPEMSWFVIMWHLQHKLVQAVMSRDSRLYSQRSNNPVIQGKESRT